MQDPQLTHHIERAIMHTMVTKQHLRYSELKPATIEANLFMYHLKQLIKSGLIEKQDGGYTLTRHGKHYADRVTIDEMRLYAQPKIILMIAITHPDGRWLILERKYQPFINYPGFVSGKLEYGETLEAGAVRVLEQKAGLSGIDVQLRGNAIFRFTDEQQTVNHVVAYLFSGQLPDDKAVEFENDRYKGYLGPAEIFTTPPCYQGYERLLELLDSEQAFFFDQLEFRSAY